MGPSTSTAPWVTLEDGNADKEAEKLKPSPNFYVLMDFVLRIEKLREVGLIDESAYLSSSHVYTSIRACPVIMCVRTGVPADVTAGWRR